MQLASPQVTGCAPINAIAQFNTFLVWPLLQGCQTIPVKGYDWTINGPTGKFQRYIPGPTGISTDTSGNATNGWRNMQTNTVGSVDLTKPGFYGVSVAARLSGVPESCDPTDVQPFSISSCCPELIGPLNASKKPNDPCTWTFSAQVNNPSNTTVTFEWSFHDGSTPLTGMPHTDHTYAPGSSTGMTKLTLKSPSCPDQVLSVPITHSCTGVTPTPTPTPTDPTPTPTDPTPTPTPGIGCIILLILSLLFLIAGAIIVGVAACAPVSQATPILWIIGIICMIIGLILLIIWGIICARLMCNWLNTLAWVFSFLTATSAALAALFFLFGNPCGVGALVNAIEWGLALSIVGWISGITGCRIFTTPII